MQFCYSVSNQSVEYIIHNRIDSRIHNRIHNNVKMSQITDYFRKKGKFGSLLIMVESGQINFTEKLFSFGMHTPGWRDTQTCLSGLKICPLSDTWTSDLSLQWKLVLAMKMEKEKRRSIVKTGGYNTFLRWPKISWPADYTIRNIILSFWSDIYGKLSFL